MAVLPETRQGPWHLIRSTSCGLGRCAPPGIHGETLFAPQMLERFIHQLAPAQLSPAAKLSQPLTIPAAAGLAWG